MSEVSHAVATGAHRVDKDASSNQDPHAEHHVPMSTYTIIIILLMVGLIVTVIAAFIPLGPFNMPVAMLIASAKAALVILYFMHVKFASRLTKVFVAASFTWLAILFGITFFDYISRGWLSNSRGWEDNPVKAAYDDGVKRDHGHDAAKDNTGGKHPGDPAAGETKQGTQPHKAPDVAPGRPGAG
jgi:cytochrome c oxidase subunit IV